MAVITRTTFDLSNGSDLTLPGGPFDGTTSIFGVQWGVVASPTPFNFGQVLRTSPFFLGNLYKNMVSNQQSIFFMLRCRCNSGVFSVGWDDVAGTRQVEIVWDGVSDIYVVNAHGELARWRNAYSEGQWNHFQVRTFIDHDLGLVRIRKNGATKDSFEACNLNTQETAHAYANAVRLTTGSNAAWSYVKDFAAWDMQGPGPWNNWMGDIRTSSRMAMRDDSVTMTKTYPVGRSTTFGFPTSSFSFSTIPAELYFFPVTPPPIGGQLGNLTLVMNAGFTGHVIAGLYAAGGYRDGIEGNGDVPGSLLAQTNVVTNPVTGANTLTWASTAPSVATGAKYWLAIQTDVAASVSNQSGGVDVLFMPGTYTGSLPDPVDVSAATLDPFSFPPTLSCTLTVTNAACVDELPEDAGTTMVSSDVLNDEDMYGIEGLPPKGFKNIVGADLVMLAAKSTAGSRGISAKLKSGATVVIEPEFFPNTSFNYSKYAQDVDPATGLPWVKADLDAITIGAKITT